MNDPAHIKIKKFVLELCFKHPQREQQIPTEIELCGMFKVTRPTVRKALQSLVSERILIIRRGSGTFTNPAKLSCGERHGNKSLLAGIIIHSGKEVIMTNYISEIISGITMALSSSGVFARIINLSEISDKSDSEIAAFNIDCLIWANPPDEALPVIKKLTERNIAVTILNNASSCLQNYNADIVLSDIEYEGQLIADYFIGRGHQKILFISKDNLRFESFRKSLAARGIAYNMDLHVDPGLNMNEDILLRIESGAKFTGIYIHGYYIDNLLLFLERAVPCYKEQYQILGNDFAMRGNPDLNCFDRIQVSLFEIGKTGAELALERAQSPDVQVQTVKFKPCLIEFGQKHKRACRTGNRRHEKLKIISV